MAGAYMYEVRALVRNGGVLCMGLKYIYIRNGVQQWLKMA
jgi:hypothetical protein